MISSTDTPPPKSPSKRPSLQDVDVSSSALNERRTSIPALDLALPSPIPIANSSLNVGLLKVKLPNLPMSSSSAFDVEQKSAPPSSAETPRTVAVGSSLPDTLKPALPVQIYPSAHRVTMTRYATSTDKRGYLPVFEYPLNGHFIMIDCETGFVHFTGIWKALGHTKADVVKLVESDPTIGPHVKKVRGGYLRVQGTWLPLQTAEELARRVAWEIRYDLIPLFGPGFPDTCLRPGEPGFGQLLLSAPKPRGRRSTRKLAAPPSRVDASSESTGSMETGPVRSYRVATDSLYGGGPPINGANSGSTRYSPYARPSAPPATYSMPAPVYLHNTRHALENQAASAPSVAATDSPRLANTLSQSPFLHQIEAPLAHSGLAHQQHQHQQQSYNNVTPPSAEGDNWFRFVAPPNSFAAQAAARAASGVGFFDGTAVHHPTAGFAYSEAVYMAPQYPDGFDRFARRPSSAPEFEHGMLERIPFAEHQQQLRRHPNESAMAPSGFGLDMPRPYTSASNAPSFSTMIPSPESLASASCVDPSSEWLTDEAIVATCGPSAMPSVQAS